MNDMPTKDELESLLPPGYEPVMELAGNLANEKHEGKPVGFAFLVGTDTVWPAISGRLSADFGIPDHILYSQRELEDSKLKIELTKTICKSNYSIFQIFGAAGFYNTGSRQFVDIVRLTHPLEDEQLGREKIVDLDDLFCFAVKKIWKDAHEEKACIINTAGDGRVRIYAFKNESGEGDLVYVWNVNEGKIKRPISPEIARKVVRFLGAGNKSQDLLKVIRKVSTTVGEGALLILAKKRKFINKFLVKMEYFKPEWQINLNLTVPKELLKAAFIMDGSTLIVKEKQVKIEPRYSVYPCKDNQAYGLLRSLSKLFATNEERRKVAKKLSGKGSKTHSAANLSHLLKENQVMIITISADGPIYLWPDELVKEES